MTPAPPAAEAAGAGPRSGAGAFDVIGVGANSIDFVYTLPAYPQPEGSLSKLRIASAERSPGGQTATLLCACAALGLRTRYIGTISSDDNGRLVREAMVARGVDVSRAIERDAANPYAVILVATPGAASTGERIVLWDRPSAMTLRREDLPADFPAGVRLVHVDDVDTDAAIAAGRAAMAAGIPVTSDIEAVKPLTRELIGAVTIPIFAEQVPSQLTGQRDLEAAMRGLWMPHMTLLCVTLGAAGAAMLVRDRFVRQSAFHIDAVDTTGAGDVFRAGFIFALLRGDGPDEILRFACAAAAVSCTRRGAINSVPAGDDVARLLQTV